MRWQPCNLLLALAVLSAMAFGAAAQTVTNRDQVGTIIAVTTSCTSRLWMINTTRSTREGLVTYVVHDNAEEVRAENQAYTSTRHRFIYQADRLGSNGTTSFVHRAAWAPFLAFNASNGDFQWLLYGDDDTVWNLANVRRLLEGYDSALPYVISDSFNWRNPYQGCPYDHGGVEKAFMMYHPKAPRCLPCHFQKPPGWGDPIAPMVPGCPCTPELACQADPPVCNMSKGTDFWIPTLYGGTGWIMSRGLFTKLNLTGMEECVAMQSKVIDYSDGVLSGCLWMYNVSATDPGPLLFNRGHMFSLERGSDHMLPALERCLRPVTGLSCGPGFTPAAVSFHMHDLRFMDHEVGGEMLAAIMDKWDAAMWRLVSDERVGGAHPVGLLLSLMQYVALLPLLALLVVLGLRRMAHTRSRPRSRTTPQRAPAP